MILIATPLLVQGHGLEPLEPMSSFAACMNGARVASQGPCGATSCQEAPFNAATFSWLAGLGTYLFVGWGHEDVGPAPGVLSEDDGRRLEHSWHGLFVGMGL